MAAIDKLALQVDLVLERRFELSILQDQVLDDLCGRNWRYPWIVGRDAVGLFGVNGSSKREQASLGRPTYRQELGLFTSGERNHARALPH